MMVSVRLESGAGQLLCVWVSVFKHHCLATSNLIIYMMGAHTEVYFSVGSHHVNYQVRGSKTMMLKNTHP